MLDSFFNIFSLVNYDANHHTFAFISFKALNMVGSRAMDAFVTATLSVELNASDLFVSLMACSKILMTASSFCVIGIAPRRLPSKLCMLESRVMRSLLIVLRSKRTVEASRLRSGAPRAMLMTSVETITNDLEVVIL